MGKNEKIRVLKKTNKTIQAKLMAMQPNSKVKELIELLGYESMDDEVSAFTGKNYSMLIHGVKMLEDQTLKIKMLIMSPEERKKHELIIKEREEFLAAKKAREAERK